MNKYFPAAAGTLGILFLLSCNNGPCKLTSTDSENISASWTKFHPKANFHADALSDAQLTEKLDQKHTKPISLGEAQDYVRQYGTVPLPDLQVRNPTGPGFIPIKAFELDKNVLDTVRKYDTIWGLRVYFGRRPDSEYTLVIVPKNEAQDNILGKPWLFDWNNPCPPYCPPAAQKFPD